MNRRQLLKRAILGALGVASAPLALGAIKSERGVQPRTASPNYTFKPPALGYLFQEDPDADYVLQDDEFNFHFYPKEPSLTEWFETDHYIPPQDLGNEIRTRGIVFVKYKDGVDKYAGYAAVLGVPRHVAKQARYRQMYGIRDPEWHKGRNDKWFHVQKIHDEMYVDGTLTGRFKSKTKDGLRFKPPTRPYPRPIQKVEIINVESPTGWGDYAQLEARVKAVLESKSDIIRDIVEKGK